MWHHDICTLNRAMYGFIGHNAAIIEATEDIPAGTEITVSYVDDSLELDERQHELRDYGFTCHCERCEAEKICFETA